MRRPEVIDADDIRMVQPGQGAGLAGEALGKGRVAADLRRQNLYGDQAVQVLLPGFIDRAHAAAAEQFEDFQLWKPRSQVFDAKQRRFWRAFRRRRGQRRLKAGIGWLLALEPGQHQAFRAESRGRAGGYLAAALRAELRFAHGWFPFAFSPAAAPRR